MGHLGLKMGFIRSAELSEEDIFTVPMDLMIACADAQLPFDAFGIARFTYSEA